MAQGSSKVAIVRWLTEVVVGAGVGVMVGVGFGVGVGAGEAAGTVATGSLVLLPPSPPPHPSKRRASANGAALMNRPVRMALSISDAEARNSLRRPYASAGVDVPPENRLGMRSAHADVSFRWRG